MGNKARFKMHRGPPALAFCWNGKSILSCSKLVSMYPCLFLFEWNSSIQRTPHIGVLLGGIDGPARTLHPPGQPGLATFPAKQPKRTPMAPHPFFLESPELSLASSGSIMPGPKPGLRRSSSEPVASGTSQRFQGTSRGKPTPRRRRWPFGKMDGPGKWNKPHLSHCHLFLSCKGHLWTWMDL